MIKFKNEKLKDDTLHLLKILEDENYEKEVYIEEETIIDFAFPDIDSDYEEFELLDSIEFFKEADEGNSSTNYQVVYTSI